MSAYGNGTNLQRILCFIIQLEYVISCTVMEVKSQGLSLGDPGSQNSYTGCLLKWHSHQRRNATLLKEKSQETVT